eukprot:TRINITY_DN16509_c0_g1_i1.p1 TRINITY_DN16509_c0_g1~~TRINITY_DN16509_c0_g1_i1.p1  ORF type:complete len:242 (+),score=89.54 TRINITY_DN16509_c0_g1_i1:70-795(+)
MASEDDRKLFCGALPQEAKENDVKEYFSQFGEVENINLKMDPMTGRSRGFCFIVFKEVSGLEAAVGQEGHVVKGKKVTVKKAEAKQGKIYLGKVPAELSKEDIQAHFAEFGEVAEVVRPVDKQKNDEPKNFAFITFNRDETAKQLVKQGETTINGHKLLIKRVTPKEQGGGGGWGPQGGMGWGGFDPYGYGGYGGYGDPYAYGGYGGGGWGGPGGFGGAGGKMRGGPGGRGGRGRGRGRPY